MSRLVGRCPWCQRTVEIELALLAMERWTAQEGLAVRGPGRPRLPAGEVPLQETMRKYRQRERKREKREQKGEE